jgi:hypothetical protein
VGAADRIAAAGSVGAADRIAAAGSVGAAARGAAECRSFGTEQWRPGVHPASMSNAAPRMVVTTPDDCVGFGEHRRFCG